MTIGELIEKLETFDPEQDVCIMLDGSEGAGMFDIDSQPTECGCEDREGKEFTETVIGLYPVDAAVEETEYGKPPAKPWRNQKKLRRTFKKFKKIP